MVDKKEFTEIRKQLKTREIQNVVKYETELAKQWDNLLKDINDAIDSAIKSIFVSMKDSLEQNKDSQLTIFKIRGRNRFIDGFRSTSYISLGRMIVALEDEEILLPLNRMKDKLLEERKGYIDRIGFLIDDKYEDGINDRMLKMTVSIDL